MENLARRQPTSDEENRYVDWAVASELDQAGIKRDGFEIFRTRGEVPTQYIGTLHKWSFQRYWRYWVCEGPGIPLEYADPLHERLGEVIRVDGHCGCPSPREWFNGFAVGHYHVDTQEGLNALADTIRKVFADNEAKGACVPVTLKVEE